LPASNKTALIDNLPPGKNNRILQNRPPKGKPLRSDAANIRGVALKTACNAAESPVYPSAGGIAITIQLITAANNNIAESQPITRRACRNP
jgi:hypothetical protein